MTMVRSYVICVSYVIRKKKINKLEMFNLSDWECYRVALTKYAFQSICQISGYVIWQKGQAYAFVYNISPLLHLLRTEI